MSDSNEKHTGRKAAKIIAVVLGSAVALVVCFIVALTLLLTPGRLTRLINKEGSEMLNADVKAFNARFTVWSTFPHFCVRLDSLYVRSRALDALPDSIRRLLPPNSDFLLSSGPLEGGIDLMKLLCGKIYLRDVEAERLDINLVAASDSVSNWNIWHNSPSEKDIPFITATEVRILHPGKLRFYSRVTGLDSEVELASIDLQRHPSDLSTYVLALGGKISAGVENLRVLTDFPFTLDGRLRLHFKPFSITADNYSFSLGNTRGKINMSLEMGKEMKLNDFSCRLDNFSLGTLLDYFPSLRIPMLSGLKADLDVRASARLKSPYLFSIDRLPSAEVDFEIADNDISYAVDQGERYSMRLSGASGRLEFDGENPARSRFVVPPFRLSGEGMEFKVRAEVSDLTDAPSVDVHVDGDVDMKSSGRRILLLRQYDLRGRMLAEMNVRFSVSDIRRGKLNDVRAQGDIALSDYAADSFLPGYTAEGKNLRVRFLAAAGDLDNDNLSDGLFSIGATCDSLRLCGGGNVIVSRGIVIGSHLADRGVVRIDSLVKSLPFNVDVKAGCITFDRLSDTLNLRLDDVDLTGLVRTAPRRLVARELDLTVKGRHMSLDNRGISTRLNGIDGSLKAFAMRRPVFSEPFRIPAAWETDTARIAFTRHTPLFIKARLPENIKTQMSRWRTAATLRFAEADIRSESFPEKNTVRDLDMAASFDSVVLRNVDIRSGESKAVIKGKITNLRQFLSSPTPAPLRVSLDMAMDTVQINQLAAAYEAGVERLTGRKPGKPVKQKEITSSDSVALLVPRNLEADIRASALQTRYTNLHLYDLSTGVRLKDGKAFVDDLRISADFGHARLNFGYDTSDIQRLGMALRLGILDVDVVKFFRNFHSLLLMMPQMKNLSGSISAECEGSMLLFPSMYINIPSVNADMKVEGRDLQVHQTPFIRHITRMMLIPDSNDLHIADMTVHAGVHDNLLELYPFNFEFSRYKLRMAGLNNFNGRLYYHIGVDRSPVPFPFGINIVGMFHHPELRFGGARFKVDKSTEITSSVMEDNRVNLVRELKYYLQEFVHTAAVSNGD